MSRSLPLPRWPNGASVAVSLTFDVDAESSLLGRSEGYEHRLSSLSEGRYGVVRGLKRILELLDRRDVPATFYVPGDTAERHGDAVRSIHANGHEVGHHGYLHLLNHQITPSQQREEVERGMSAILGAIGIEPRGYRSPAWELTSETLRLLSEHGFRYDSSCMGDDRPYVEAHDGASILELPVHWSLDDVPYFKWSVEDGGILASPSVMEENWLEELENAAIERRLVTYTMHPEVIGRAYRLRSLDRMIATMQERTNIWFARHSDVAEVVLDVEGSSAQFG
jgi:peptidoglycan/xylan/chitin deacetylase (PgdA/CDA1 family)